MRRLLTILAVAGATIAPATPAFAHAGDARDATAYRTTVTGLSTPEKGLSVRTVEAGARLELTNETGHSVEVLGYSGEPYLDIRPDGTYQNTSSPAAYLNETITGDTPVPAYASPTSAPTWRKISSSTTVRWHDQRTHWLSPGLPPQAVADPSRSHRLRDWVVPLREQVRTFELRGTLDWEPAPRASLWWLGAALAGLATVALARRFPRSVRPLALVAGLTPLLYAVTTALDGTSPSPVLVLAGLIGLAAAYRHPPFFLALAGAVVAIFGGFDSAGVFGAAVLPAYGPGWLTRLAVLLAAGVGAGLALTGVLRMRAALPAAPPERTIVAA
ncbi:hypothetical protein Ade02nite_24660 [Paractinoplanes deccanensis]|uniref:Uncharacterized protein n=1 Tax=Paractinoplanes deccanensis TaxID=113561 RepID=A0ABQ3Y1G5_9ACTN|nr:phage holin family protein [Actinoplanes deccanensis]GID73825.1 hypothetical protein Ade02nite_24660 [Actinoplanes deccanensis]